MDTLGTLLAWLSWGLYRTLGAVAAVPYVLYASYKGRFGGRWPDRLGFPVAGGNAPLWLHGASVGEISSAMVLVRSIYRSNPSQAFLLSSGTPQGLLAAERLLGQFQGQIQQGQASLPPLAAQVMAPPLDFFGSPQRSLDRVRPLALILIESEIWPELLRAAERRSVPVILAAGRLGSKAMRHFRPFASLVKPIFSSMALIAAISQGDLERFLELGAREERAKVLGNPKFDALIALAREGAFEDPREGEGPLDIVAGSTHPGEEGLIIRAFLSARDSYRSRADGKKKALRLILAPRHPLRAPEALKEASDCGLSAGYIQNPLDPEGYGLEVGLVDRLGLLNLFYRRSLISLVGGSFFPAYQGHNPLEPAAFARPIICGPFMESFAQEAKELREAGAAFIAKDGPELADVLASLLNNPDLAQESGRKGRAALAQRPEAGPLYAKAIQRILDAEKARL